MNRVTSIRLVVGFLSAFVGTSTMSWAAQKTDLRIEHQVGVAAYQLEHKSTLDFPSAFPLTLRLIYPNESAVVLRFEQMGDVAQGLIRLRVSRANLVEKSDDARFLAPVEFDWDTRNHLTFSSRGRIGVEVRNFRIRFSRVFDFKSALHLE